MPHGNSRKIEPTCPLLLCLHTPTWRPLLVHSVADSALDANHNIGFLMNEERRGSEDALSWKQVTRPPPPPFDEAEPLTLAQVHTCLIPPTGWIRHWCKG